jgi:superfamily I DNA/RNA helicase
MTRRVWMIGRGLLTEQQEQIVTLPTDRNHLVTGPPGSGKSVLLLHRADEILRNQSVSPSQLRVLVFTHVLRVYMDAGAEALHLPLEIIQSFYSWVFQLADREGLPRSKATRLEDKCKETLETAADYFETQRPEPVFDVVLVDEGQDLPLSAYRLLLKASRHVTVFADSTQKLYLEGANLEDAAAVLGIPNGGFTLAENLRSSVGVARLAAQLLSPAQRDMYLKTQRNRITPGTTRVPLLLRAATFEQEWQRIAEILRHEIASNMRVGILVPDNAMVTCVYRALTAVGLPLQKVMARDPAQADFNDLTPKVLTIFSAKGLSFDTVLVPGITRSHYSHAVTQPTRMLFVACTRALDWVCLSTIEGKEIRELAHLAPLVVAGHLAEQRGPIRPAAIRGVDLPVEDAPF